MEKKEIKTEKIEEKVDIDPNRLLACLYFIFDAMDRIGMEFFLIRKTAKDAKKSIFNNLSGDHIEIGVRQNEWVNDHKQVLFAFFDQEGVGQTRNEPSLLEFKWQDIPFVIRLYEDNPCITSLIPITFQHEHFNIPNQFERFEKEFDK